MLLVVEVEELPADPGPVVAGVGDLRVAHGVGTHQGSHLHQAKHHEVTALQNTHLQGGEAECGVKVGHDVVIVGLGRREGVHVGGVGRGGAVLMGIVRMYTQ